MKTPFRHLAAALLLAIASPSEAADLYFKATVTGTVQTQLILAISNGRIRTVPMNNRRIFQEFAVSPQDYELVVQSGQLILLPKLAASNLPALVVVGLDSGQILVNTKTHTQNFQSSIATNAATNLFKGLAGEIAGTLWYKDPLANPTFTKFVYTVTARGTDPVGGVTTSALLKFKVKTSGVFVQQ